MKNPLVELPINEEDLQTVSEILAPLYKTTAEGEAKDIKAVIRDKKGKRITSFDYDHQVDELVQWWRKIGERMRMTEDEVEKAYDAHWD